MKPFVINKEAFDQITIRGNHQFEIDVKYGGEPEPKPVWKKNDQEISPNLEEK